MLRSLKTEACDTCAQPAVTVMAIERPGGGDLLRAVCAEHLEAALHGARPISATAPRARRHRGAVRD